MNSPDTGTNVEITYLLKCPKGHEGKKVIYPRNILSDTIALIAASQVHLAQGQVCSVCGKIMLVTGWK
ncbi:MAG: hypothetical protein WC659_00385 [Patescibacteria group bacterium]